MISMEEEGLVLLSHGLYYEGNTIFFLLCSLCYYQGKFLFLAQIF